VGKMGKRIREFVIVGGGSAGWVTAACMARLLLKSQYGGYKITLVESSDIGIVGVGEATIPSLQDLLSYLNIDEADFVRSTNATYKLAIKFQDWAKIGEGYFHPFGDMGPLVENTALYFHWLQNRATNENIVPLQDLAICTAMAKQNKFCKPERDAQSVRNWLSYAYHFDAGLFADYLKGYGKAKGVNHVIGTINEVKQNANGDIETLNLSDGRKISGDFFIDCSGFAALLIDKTLGSQYEDWTNFLPVDSAVAMPTKTTYPITPYTLSTAREAGWTWRIPLQNRVGNGYVYSSKFSSDERAKEVLMSAIDAQAIAEPRIIKFKAGRRRESWVKNCLSLGLASGFLEPLESTAIHLVIASVFRFFDHFPRTYEMEYMRKTYNSRFVYEMEEIRDFLILHYCTSKRDDSEFWKYVTTMPIPDSLQGKINIFKDQGKVFGSFADLFRPASWVSVLVGMNIIPQNTNPVLDTIPPDFSMRIINDVAKTIAQNVQNAPSHEQFLSQLTGRKV
jgi:tryptophan 7-halogenase